MYYQKIVLSMLNKIERERSINSVYHILKGKKSAQTIQDINLFQLENFFGIYPKLKNETYSQWVELFIKNNWIDMIDDTFEMTNSGKKFVRTYGTTVENMNFKGQKYNRIDYLFYQTLQLLCQTISNLIHKNQKFIPVVEENIVQFKVKEILNQYKYNRQELYDGLFYDLFNVFNQLNRDDDVELFVLQLTSSKQIGLSQKQIADHYQISLHDIYLRTTEIIHYLLSTIESKHNNYPFLEMLVPKRDESHLTQSALKTYQLFKKGMDLNHISTIRHLKISTIEDHVVEIATQIPTFSIEPFVDKNVQQHIFQKLKVINSKRLKIIKDSLELDASYFQIRLTLAKWQNINRESKANEPTT